MAYHEYGSDSPEDTHDLNFHPTKEPAAADKCGPMCSIYSFDKGSYNATSPCSETSLMLFAHFIPKTQGNVKRDPVASGTCCFPSDETLTSHSGLRRLRLRHFHA
jgi:hypothetical protein